MEESNLSPVGFEYGLGICDCPFCGSAYVEIAGYQRVTGDPADEKGQRFVGFNVMAVWCNHCKAKGPQVEHISQRHAARLAIRRWNCRA